MLVFPIPSRRIQVVTRYEEVCLINIEMISLSCLIRSDTVHPKALGFHIGGQAPNEIFDVSQLKNLNFHLGDLLVFSLSILYHISQQCQYKL